MTMLFGFGCECCDVTVCTFSVKITVFSCFDNDDTSPNGPSSGSDNPVATGTMTYNEVEYPIRALPSTGTPLTWTSPEIDKIDDELEVIIELDPSWLSYPPEGPKDDPTCDYPLVFYEYDSVSFVPDCGINNQDIIGKEMGRRVLAVIEPCTQLMNQSLPPDQLLGYQRGLQGAIVRITTPIGIHECTLGQFLHYARCLNPNGEPIGFGYECRDYSLGYVDPADPMIITYEFIPPPGIPGYKYVSYDNILFRSFDGDTCGMRWYATNTGNFPVCPTVPGDVRNILKDGYMCGFDGYPHSKKVSYSDGMFSGTLTATTSCFGDVWQGILSGFCSDARTILERPFPQAPCCQLTGGIVNVFIRVGTGINNIQGPNPPPPAGYDGYNYQLFKIEKSIPYCTFKCEGGGGFNDTPLVGANPLVAPSTQVTGSVWVPLPHDYELIDVTIPLTHPIGGTFPCLYGTASIIEVLP